MNKFLLACALLLSCLALPRLAQATECTEITTAAFTITAPGHYCLGADIVSGQTGVTIGASHVDLDCRGYSLRSTNTNSAQNTFGVYVNTKVDVHVHHCHISGGYAIGIYAYQDNGLVNVNQNMSFEDNTISDAFWIGILAYGTGISIRDNRIHDIGGRASFAMGIRIGGSTLAGEPRFFVVDGNDISGVDSPGNNAYGIYANNSDGSVITDNAIAGMRTHNGSYDAVGVSLLLAENTRITGNTITGTPAVEDIGIVAPASNACFDNLIRAVSTPTLSCDATHGNF